VSEPEVNIPLLRKAVEWAEAEAQKPVWESQWRQGSYIWPAKHRHDWYLSRLHEATVDREQLEKHCGTAYCIAGYVGQLLEPGYASESAHRGVHVFAFAANALGLTEDQADSLFDGSNTIEDVRQAAEEIAGEKL
jgi:hypothetical protein